VAGLARGCRVTGNDGTRAAIPGTAGTARAVSADTITLTGVTATGFHGVYPDERRDGQRFIVDVVLHLDLAPAAASDDVADTVHYGELADELVAAIERDAVDLIETLAERLAQLCLAREGVHRATVTVHKPEAPIAVPFGDVAVTITRDAEPSRAVVALGANLGDRIAALDDAIAALDALPATRVVAHSRWHDSVALTPEGPDPSKPGYLNGVALVDTALAPTHLLHHLLRIEREHGRDRSDGVERWADRTLDLDLIQYDDVVRNDARLTLPHPRAHEREFVLEPWLDIDPDARLGTRGRVADLLAALRASDRDAAGADAPGGAS